MQRVLGVRQNFFNYDRDQHDSGKHWEVKKTENVPCQFREISAFADCTAAMAASGWKITMVAYTIVK